MQERVAEVILPGFRFHPTDEELVGFYLQRKVQQKALPFQVITQLDIYNYDPWELPKMALCGENAWYFFCLRDQKLRSSLRPNRVTKNGFWKATGPDRPICSVGSSSCIGLKKSLVFYRGKATKATKTDWVMHEFRLPVIGSGSSTVKFDSCEESWSVCRIFRKRSSYRPKQFVRDTEVRDESPERPGPIQEEDSAWVSASAPASLDPPSTGLVYDFFARAEPSIQ